MPVDAAGENRTVQRRRVRTSVTGDSTITRDQPHGDALFPAVYFILLLSPFSHSLSFASTWTLIGLKANAQPRFPFHFIPSKLRVSSHCLELLAYGKHTEGIYIHTPVDLFYVRCLHKFSCMFPRVCIRSIDIKMYICHRCAALSNSTVFNQALLSKCVWFDLSLKSRKVQKQMENIASRHLSCPIVHGGMKRE